MAVYQGFCESLFRLVCEPDIAKWEASPEDIREAAVELAFMALQSLTAYAYPACPIVLRPCGWDICPPSSSQTFLDFCGCAGSRCQGGHSFLPWGDARVSKVVSVKIDGVTLDPALYFKRRDGLVRTDREPWPIFQDMTQPDSEPGTFSITYVHGTPMSSPIAGEVAYGALVVEYLKFCSGEACRISPKATSVRKGNAEFNTSDGMFPNGYTNIPAVDTFIRWLNPHKIAVEFGVSGGISHARDI